MTWTEALESLASDPHLWRYRELCDEDNPNLIQRDKYRGLVIRIVTDDPTLKPGGSRPLAYPPIAIQVGNALGAAAQFVKSGFATVTQEEFDRRLAICKTCEFLDATRNRCVKCSCHLAVKPWGKAWHCPIAKW